MISGDASSASSVLPQVSLRDLTRIFFHRFWGMATIFVVVLFAALVYLLVIKDDTYVVTAKLLVKLGYEQDTGPTASGDRLSIVGYRHQDILSEVEILKSTEFLERVVDELHLDRIEAGPVPEKLLARIKYELKRVMKDLREWINEWMIAIGFRPRLSPREVMVATLAESLRVDSAGDSNVVTASLGLPSRVGSSKVLDKLLDIYLQSRLKLFQDAAVIDVFAKQRDDALSQLRQSEAALNRLEAANSIVDLGPQKDLLLKQISDARTAIMADEAETAALRHKLERVKASTKAESPDLAVLSAIDGNAYQGSLLRSLASLEQERITLELTESERAESIRNNRRKFQAIGQALVSNLQAELSARQTRLAEQQASVARLVERSAALHDRDVEWRTLSRQVAIDEEHYRFYQKKLEEATANNVMERQRVGNVSIIQHPIDPVKPAGLQKSMFMAIAAVLGAFAALTWAAVAEFFDHAVYSSDQVRQHLGAPVIAQVPRVRPRLARTVFAARGRG